MTWEYTMQWEQCVVQYYYGRFWPVSVYHKQIARHPLLHSLCFAIYSNRTHWHIVSTHPLQNKPGPILKDFQCDREVDRVVEVPTCSRTLSGVACCLDPGRWCWQRSNHAESHRDSPGTLAMDYGGESSGEEANPPKKETTVSGKHQKENYVLWF